MPNDKDTNFIHRGKKGDKGDPGINSINSITHRQYLMMWGVFWFAAVSFAVMLATPFVLFSYPFKAVTFVVPVEILNPGKIVDCRGTVDMKVYYEKFVSTPGLTIRTLGCEKNGMFYALDSNTVISNLSKGKGEVNDYYVLPQGTSFAGKDRRIVFTIYHWLFGFRPVMEQYVSEPFEITECKDEKK